MIASTKLQHHTHTHTHTHTLSLSLSLSLFLSLSTWQKPNSLFLWNAPNYSLTCNLLWKVRQFWVCPKELDVMTLLYCRCAQTTHTGLCFAFLLFSFIFIFLVDQNCPLHRLSKKHIGVTHH